MYETYPYRCFPNTQATTRLCHFDDNIFLPWVTIGLFLELRVWVLSVCCACNRAEKPFDTEAI